MRRAASALLRAARAGAAGPRLARGLSDDAGVLTVAIPVPFETHKCDPPPQSVTTSKCAHAANAASCCSPPPPYPRPFAAEVVKMFSDAYMMRRMEIAADVLYKSKACCRSSLPGCEGQRSPRSAHRLSSFFSPAPLLCPQFIRGFCHLYDGQEAICIGMEAALTHHDAVITSYRDHCTHVGRGGTVDEVMGELLGRVTGPAKGKGGSMHMYRPQARYFGGNGIVGAQTALGAGLAFAIKYGGQPNCAVAMYGDGAANQGQLFEALNIAALWDLPLVYVCENNHVGMGTTDARSAKAPQYYKRGDYVPGLKVDGMDALAVKAGMAYAKAHCVAGKGPIIVEMDTYRYHGHSMSDPGSSYRTRDEISKVRQERDPVERLRKLVTELGLLDAGEIKALEKEQRAVVDRAVANAKAAAEPAPGALFEDVYVASLGAAARGVDARAVHPLR